VSTLCGPCWLLTRAPPSRHPCQRQHADSEQEPTGRFRYGGGYIARAHSPRRQRAALEAEDVLAEDEGEGPCVQLWHLRFRFPAAVKILDAAEPDLRTLLPVRRRRQSRYNSRKPRYLPEVLPFAASNCP
jgi:hypothetical protein